MRVYISEKEAQLIRLDLIMEKDYMTDSQQAIVRTILDRIDLCEQLQNNERRANENAK